MVTLREIAQLLQDHVNCHLDFTGPWSGWRMRGATLIPPGGTYRGSNITASNALGYRRWLASFQGEQAQLEFHNEQTRHWEKARPTSQNHCPAPSDHQRIALDPPPGQIQTWPTQRAVSDPETATTAYEPRRRADVIELAKYRKKAQ